MLTLFFLKNYISHSNENTIFKYYISWQNPLNLSNIAFFTITIKHKLTKSIIYIVNWCIFMFNFLNLNLKLVFNKLFSLLEFCLALPLTSILIKAQLKLAAGTLILILLINGFILILNILFNDINRGLLSFGRDKAILLAQK